MKLVGSGSPSFIARSLLAYTDPASTSCGHTAAVDTDADADAGADADADVDPDADVDVDDDKVEDEKEEEEVVVVAGDQLPVLFGGPSM